MKNPKICVGDVFPTRSGGDCVVITILPRSRMSVRFTDEAGYETITTSTSLHCGSVKNPYAPSVFGVGFIGVGPHAVSINRRDSELYGRWKAILQRCFSEKWHDGYPTYRGCTIDPGWLNFQVFASWVSDQTGFGIDDWQIDKDFVEPGNKHYGPDTCALMPQRLNKLMTGTSGQNGLPRGVSWHSKYDKYGATCRDGSGKDVFLGRYDSAAEAFSAYKSFKEVVIKSATEAFRSILDPRLYKSLMSYEVSP